MAPLNYKSLYEAFPKSIFVSDAQTGRLLSGNPLPMEIHTALAETSEGKSLVQTHKPLKRKVLYGH